ncbi:DUF6933 domain-containing protein [Peribacillus sp. NPDC097675]|uniref:DUF6933 domain-containing protein n=1 Tax=Peribacillus sp. NPDC097675 TaxID=3390618 RepID=UPI003D08E9DA
MFLVGATQKVLKNLDIKAVPFREGMEEGEMDRWHVNSFKIGRYTCLTMMNDLTLYCVTIVGVKKKDFLNFQELLVQHVRESLIAEEIDPEIINSYLEKGKEMIITNTNNRSTLGYLKEVILSIQYDYPLGRDIAAADIKEINHYNNRFIYLRSSGYPINLMKEQLEKM